MRFAILNILIIVAGFSASSVAAQVPSAHGVQSAATQSELSPVQRLEVVRSKLEALRRNLSGALAAMGGNDDNSRHDKKVKVSPDDPRQRLKGLDKEASSLLSEVSDLRGKQDRAEHYEPSSIDKLESAASDLDSRAQIALRETAGQRKPNTAVASSRTASSKKKHGFMPHLFGHKEDDKFGELTSTVAPGRDRELFLEATRQARKSNYEQSRYLYNVIITTYPDSAFLAAAKLAIADTFYLEGETSSLIQSGAAYQDWVTFFPTHPLTERVMLKIAEVEMRQMGLPDNDPKHAIKAEQRLKVILQQFPDTPLRAEILSRLNQVQENLAMHDLHVGNFYFDRYTMGRAPNPKGAESRYLEIVQKYPNFSFMDFVLFRLGITYVQEEEPDEAAKYFQELVKSYPDSDYADKAKEQLGIIGAAVPEPAANRPNQPEHPHVPLASQVMQQIFRTPAVTVDKNGVLISRNGKNDLVDLAIQKNGELPSPVAPVRIAPARSTSPASASSTPGTTTGATRINAQPTTPGPPPGTTPATSTPAASQPGSVGSTTPSRSDGAKP